MTVHGALAAMLEAIRCDLAERRRDWAHEVLVHYVALVLGLTLAFYAGFTHNDLALAAAAVGSCAAAYGVFWSCPRQAANLLAWEASLLQQHLALKKIVQPRANDDVRVGDDAVR